MGREGVLRECEQLMEGTRLLTLLGMGGFGQDPRGASSRRGRARTHPDGVWFVNLAPVTDNSHVVEVAAAALQVQDEPGKSPLEALVHHVRDLRIVFVVDNCEHVLPARAR